MFQRWGALAILVSLACLGLSSRAIGEGDGPDRLITTAGTYQLYGGKVTLRIYEDKGKLNYRIARHVSKRENPTRYGTVTSGPSQPFIEKGSRWFAFVESTDDKSPKTVWIFDGRDYLRQEAFDPAREPIAPNAGFGEHWWMSRDSEVVPWIVNKSPKAVRNRLPESFKRKFEGR